MKILLLISTAVMSVAVSFTNVGDIFHKFDIQNIFESGEKRRQVFDCLMDRAPCGKYQVIREKCPDILKTDCSNCTPNQKVKYQDIMKKLELEHNAAYREIIEKFKS